MMTAELRTIQIGMIAAADSFGLLAEGRGEVAETGDGRSSSLSFSWTSSIWTCSSEVAFIFSSAGAMAGGSVCLEMGVRVEEVRPINEDEGEGEED